LRTVESAWHEFFSVSLNRLGGFSVAGKFAFPVELARHDQGYRTGSGPAFFIEAWASLPHAQRLGADRRQGRPRAFPQRAKPGAARHAHGWRLSDTARPGPRENFTGKLQMHRPR